MALANIQWEYGRLLDNVKEEAIKRIRSGIDLERWEEDKKLYEKRKEELKKLEEKLKKTMPEEKRVAKHRIYKCPWNIGDIYAYQIKENEEYKGKYMCFIKISEITYSDQDTNPTVYVYNKLFDEIPTEEQLKGVKYLPQFYKPSVYERNVDKKILYKCDMWIQNSTKRYIKDYIYIGNNKKYLIPNNEDDDSYFCCIKRFEEFQVEFYNKWKGIEYKC